MYRPQFAYPTPPGYTDLDFDHYFDENTVPQLGTMATQNIWGIVLQLDDDADFIWRGIKIPCISTNNVPQSIGLQFRAPDGRYITAGFVPLWLYGLQSGNSILFEGPGCILESEIYCPKGSAILMDLEGFLGSGATLGAITLTGVKRWSAEQCCGEACHA